MGTPVAEVIRTLGITEQTFFRWEQKYAGMLPSDVKRLKALEDQNRRLKHMVADLSLDKQILRDALKKSSEADPEARTRY